MCDQSWSLILKSSKTLNWHSHGKAWTSESLGEPWLVSYWLYFLFKLCVCCRTHSVISGRVQRREEWKEILCLFCMSRQKRLQLLSVGEWKGKGTRVNVILVQSRLFNLIFSTKIQFQWLSSDLWKHMRVRNRMKISWMQNQCINVL